MVRSYKYGKKRGEEKLEKKKKKTLSRAPSKHTKKLRFMVSVFQIIKQTNFIFYVPL